MFSMPLPAITSASLQRRAADADRARGDLAPGDLDRFAALLVRAQAHARRLGELRHRRDVLLERVEVEEQRRRIQL